MTHSEAERAAVVLDRIEPGVTPDYCIHGRATCIGGCGEWVWLGSETVKPVAAGTFMPLCRECATRLCSPETIIGNLRDNRRADGPHD